MEDGDAGGLAGRHRLDLVFAGVEIADAIEAAIVSVPHPGDPPAILRRHLHRDTRGGSQIVPPDGSGDRAQPEQSDGETVHVLAGGERDRRAVAAWPQRAVIGLEKAGLLCAKVINLGGKRRERKSTAAIAADCRFLPRGAHERQRSAFDGHAVRASDDA